MRVDAFAVGVVRSERQAPADAATHVDVARVADAGGRGVEEAVERVEAEEAGQHAGAADGDDRALQVPAPQRVGECPGHVDARCCLDTLDHIEVTRVDVDERQVQVRALVADVGELDDWCS